VFTAVALTACSAGARRRPDGTPAPVGPRIVVTVQPRRSGHSLPAAFVGLSLENWTLTRDQFAHTNLGEYLRAIGSTGLLRIGGNSLDQSFWTSRGEQPPRWEQGVATPASLRALAHALTGTGWRVILGVNLQHVDPARAADEARYAKRILGPALAAIEIGNEPDHYGIGEQAYFTRFRRYARALRSGVPGIALVGPDAASGDAAWLAEFARQQVRTHDIAMLTYHNYPESACNGNRPTIPDLLSTGTVRTERTTAASLVAAGKLDHVPGIIDETNSAVCWGTPGMSDVYASALWTLDYALLLAQAGVDSAEFHGRISGCNPYSPLCTLPGGSHLVAQPDFYGLLALEQVGPGAFLDVSDSNSSQVRAYAVQAAAGTLSVVLDNLGGAATVTVRLPPRDYGRARETALTTSSGKGLAATTGISIGGQQVNANGILAAPHYRPVKVTAATATLNVASHSAVILKLR
jgi:hypothetical protein